MDMRLRVRNFLGIKEADLDLDAIVLIGGPNAAGKSSIIEAIACAASMSPEARGFNTKKAAAALLHEGAKAGSVSLRYEGGSITVAYPGGDVEQQGRPTQLGSRLALGATKFMDLSAAKRTAEIAARMGTDPSEQDVWEWFHARQTGVTVPDGKIKDMIGRIGDSGWDAVHTAFREEGTLAKGRWQQVTGQRWGTKVGDEWCPEMLFADEEYILAEEQAELEVIRQKQEQMRAAGAGSQALAAQRQEIAARLPSLRAQLESAEAEEKDYQAKSEANVILRAKHIDTADAHGALQCPHCKKSLRLVPSPKDKRGALEALPALKGDDITASRKIVESVDEDQGVVLEELRRLGLLIAGLRADVAAAERAAEAPVPSKGIANDADAVLARLVDDERLQREKIQAVNALGQARLIQSEIKVLGELIEAASADGVRLKALDTKLATINETLEQISAAAEFKPVALVADGMKATYAGRAFELLSESEQWRVNLVIAVMLYETERCRVPLLIDRLDVLHPANRVGPLKMLKQRRISAVITQTTKDAQTMPNLPKARFGSVYWLSGGVLEPFTHA